MSDKPLIKVAGPYKESDDHVPNPTDMYRQLNTSGTGSVTNIKDVTPVFDVAQKAAHRQAGAALDPKDDTVDRSAVLLPDNKRDNDEVVKEVKERAKDAEKPVEVGSGYKGPNAKAAEEKTGKEGARAAASEQKEQGANTGTDGGKQPTGPASTAGDGKGDGKS